MHFTAFVSFPCKVAATKAHLDDLKLKMRKMLKF